MTSDKPPLECTDPSGPASEDAVSDLFLLGVNYWPGRSAMYWWRDFDKSALADDFERMVETGLKLVRLFLLWEEFQPRAGSVSVPCLDHLVDVVICKSNGPCNQFCFAALIVIIIALNQFWSNSHISIQGDNK